MKRTKREPGDVITRLLSLHGYLVEAIAECRELADVTPDSVNYRGAGGEEVGLAVEELERAKQHLWSAVGEQVEVGRARAFDPGITSTVVVRHVEVVHAPPAYRPSRRTLEALSLVAAAVRNYGAASRHQAGDQRTCLPVDVGKIEGGIGGFGNAVTAAVERVRSSVVQDVMGKGGEAHG